MDQTQKYVKMCEKAIEIQELWKPSNGDWFLAEHAIWCIGDAVKLKKEVNGKPIYIIVPTELSMDPYGWGCEEIKIWLPLQCQLQEMVCDGWDSRYGRFHAGQIYEWTTELKDSAYLNVFFSDEQLWLAFVMYERFDKSWNNEKENWMIDYGDGGAKRDTT